MKHSHRPYQGLCLSAIKREFDAGVNRQLICIPTAGGKTVIAADIPKLLPLLDLEQLVFIVPLEELVWQAQETFMRVNPHLTVGIVKAESRDVHADVLIASAQTIANDRRLKSINPARVSAVVVDECFPPGTLVDGLPIETITAGQIVNAVNHSTGSVVRSRVVRSMRNRASSLIRIHFANGGSITCTPNHPIFEATSASYVRADILTNGSSVVTIGNVIKDSSSVPSVWRSNLSADRGTLLLSGVPTGEHSRTKNCLSNDLLRVRNPDIVAGESSINGDPEWKDNLLESLQGCIYPGRPPEGRHIPSQLQPHRGGTEDAGEQPNAPTGSPGASPYATQGNGVEANSSRRERNQTDSSSTSSSLSSRMGYGGDSEDESARAERRPSESLQVGRREQNPNGLHRDRRILPLLTGSPGEGSEEGRIIEIVGVDRVEILKPASDGEFERLCPDGFVYNLEIEGNHNYFADGILVHNCHRSTAAMYQAIFRHLRVLKGDPNEDPKRLLLGITATPNRTDGVGLEALFSKITYEKPIKELMEEGPVIKGRVYTYLAKPKVWRFSTNIDASAAKMRKGDFSDADLSHILDSPERNKMIVKGYLERGEGFPGVTFSCDVLHAHHLAAAYNEAGVPAAVIDGKTKREQRDEISRRYRAGELRMICSCQAVVEGWDEPKATVAVMARPSKSALATTQKLGRVFRPSPSPEQYMDMIERGEEPKWVKPYSIVLDFVDSMGKHDLCSVNSLFGLPPKYDCKGAIITDAVKEIEKATKGHPLSGFKHATSLSDMTMIAETLDIFAVPEPSEEAQALSKLSWLELREGVLQLEVGRGSLEVRIGTLGDTEIFEIKDGLRRSIGSRPTLKDGLEFADSRVPREQLNLLLTDKKWRGHPPTEAQCGLLWKWSPEAKKKFPKQSELYAFAAAQFKGGDKRYGKGGLSNMINRASLQRKATA